MTGTTVPRLCDAEQLAGLLDSPEVARLLAELDVTRWTGRSGYPILAMGGEGAADAGREALQSELALPIVPAVPV